MAMAATAMAAAAAERPMPGGDRDRRLARILRAAAGYVGVVFAAGFVFGVVRTLLIAPAVGERTAELGEMPLMLVIVLLAARWRVRRATLTTAGARVAMGVTAVAMLQVLELALVLAIGEQTPRQWLLERDLVVAAAWWSSMLVMAGGPWLMGPRVDPLVAGAGAVMPRTDAEKSLGAARHPR